jgi:two-component system sensor histidine kinase VicK
MTTSAQVLSLGADLVVFLAAVSLLLVLGLRADLLGASPLGRIVLSGASVLLASAALVHGALVDRTDQQAWINGMRASAMVFLAIGCLGVAARWPRLALLAALAVFVCAEVLFRRDGQQAGDLLRFFGGSGIGVSLLLAARRSLATRIAAAAGVLLVVVVLVLSGVLSTVLTDNVSEQAIQRAKDRARIEAGLIDDLQDVALGQADFIVSVLQSSQFGANAIRQGDGDKIRASLSELRGTYDQVDFLAYFDANKQLVATAVSDATDAALLYQLSTSSTVDEAFKGSLAAAAGGIEPTQTGALLALGIQIVQIPDVRGAPTRYGAVVAGFVVNRDKLVKRVAGEDRGLIDLSLIAVPDLLLASTRPPGTLAGAPDLLEGKAGRRLVDAVFEKGREPEGTGQFASHNVFYAVAKVDRSSTSGKAAMVVTVDGSVIDAARLSLFRTLFLVALGAAAFALALAAAAGSRLGAPLRRLAVVADQISRGDLSVRSGLVSVDEIGQLGSAFDEMAGSIERMALELREGAAQMEAVLNSMADGLVAVDPLGLVAMMNPAAEAMLGVRSTREIGKPVAAVIRAQDQAGNSLAERFELPNFEAWSAQGLVKSRDTMLPVALSGAPIRSESGGVLGAVYVMRDMRREREIESAKTEFLSNISHELRTPLTPIKGYTELLRRDQQMPESRKLAPERVGVFLAEIYESSERLERIVDILVNFAAMQANRLVLRSEPVDVATLLDEVSARWRSRSEHHHVEVLVNGRPRLQADRRLLERSIDELVDNAVKFSPEGGKVTLEADLIGSNDFREVQITVSDEGIGISPSDLERIFADFSQLDGSATRRYGGLGLGLPFVQRVITAHGGTIRATSEVGRGSQFVITIPVTAGMQGNASNGAAK